MVTVRFCIRIGDLELLVEYVRREATVPTLAGC